MIEVKHLTKKYGGHTAVDDLSFTVENGQIYGFLGPNGAGKSTTMNIMTGYLGATEGEVIIDGCDILEEPEEAKKHIGYLPEQPPLYMDMTVKEYMKFVAELKKIPAKQRMENINQAMEMTKITDVQERLIKNLSKGYRQRVGLAQALLGFPEVIILDEPTVGLDPKQIIEIRDMIKSLGKKHTVILSSHIMQEISAVCDHIMIISHGKLVASDTPENLLKRMEGANTLEMNIKGDAGEIKRVLSGVEGAQVLSVKPGKEEGTVDAVVQSGKNLDLREPIFYACAQAKMPIYMMRLSDMSLEEIFLELTSGSAEDAKILAQENEEEHAAEWMAAVGAQEESGMEEKESQESFEKETQKQEDDENAGDL